jgi:hypothetical protein
VHAGASLREQGREGIITAFHRLVDSVLSIVSCRSHLVDSVLSIPSCRSHLPVRPDLVLKLAQYLKAASHREDRILKSEAMDPTDGLNIERIVNGRMTGQICGSSGKF